MYYIFETQIKPDGGINVMEITGRSTFALGNAYFFERCSKMSANTQFKSVSIMITDENLNVKEKRDILTSYVEPTEEEAPTEGAE